VDATPAGDAAGLLPCADPLQSVGAAGSQLVAHFQTLGLPSFDATPLPESEWLVEGLEQVCNSTHHVQ